MEMHRFRNSDFAKWFYPGMHIKRWLLLLMFGVAVMGIGIAYILREVYVSYTFPRIFYYLTLQFIPQVARGGMFMGIAVALTLFAIWQLSHSLLSAVLPHRNGNGSLVSTIYNQRLLRRGPKIVAIGGGTGLSIVLRGLKEYTTNLTAIVTVADDGGSSGRLRRELGILPPGDVRNCIAALADAEPLMTKLFQYRFSDGSGLAGHSFGNLFIVAMSGVVGNFEDAIRQTSRVLAVRGQIIPSTLANVTLCARTSDAETIEGESSITESKSKGSIKEVFLQPSNPPAFPEAVRAILDADLIVLGPGSLYTSVLPNLLVEGIRRAVFASPAVKVYVCNVATQPGETDGYGVREHAAAIEAHMERHAIDCVVANNNIGGSLPESARGEPVKLDARLPNGIRLVAADVVSEENRYHHDSTKLASTIIQIYDDRRQLQQLSVEEEAKLVGTLD
ncbi:MAG: YvcK family protein [Chloroflexi bacterium]|nr:YvcK family protein [Chloroflexota bacterium]